MRAPTTAPHITYPAVKGDVTIAGHVNTGRNDYCANCGHEICEIEIHSMRWNENTRTATGRYEWIHFDSRHGMACLKAVPRQKKNLTAL